MRRDREELARRADENRRLAMYDHLTGLPNRLLFQDRATQAIAAAGRDGTGVGVMILDLHRFKEVNDTLGHDRGDELLQQVGSRLQGALRAADTVARLGGDEFGILITGLGHEPEAAGGRSQADRRARCVLRAGGARDRPRRQHRDRALPGRRRGAGDPAAARGGRHVRGQGRARPVPAVHGRAGHLLDRPPRAGRGAPPRDRPGRAQPVLPAEGGPRAIGVDRDGGAGSLGPPDPWPGLPRHVHPRRRAQRADPPADVLRAAGGDPAARRRGARRGSTCRSRSTCRCATCSIRAS